MLNIRKFLEGVGIIPKTTTSADTAGEMEVLTSDNRLRYHDGSSVKIVTLNNSTDTLTNKTIDADANTITNIENADIKAAAAIDATKIADGSVSNTEFQYINSVTSNVQTQIDNIVAGTTPVTIPLDEEHVLIGDASNEAAAVDTAATGDILADATGLNIKSGVIVNADVNASAAIDATKLADGSVDNTEFQRLGAVTSAIVGISDSQTLTNKTIDGDDNTVQDLALASLKTNLTDANKFLVRDGSGIVVSNTKDVPTGAVVGVSDTQTLTNKTLTSPTINTPTTDIVTWDDTTTPANPSAGFYKTYFKSDGKLYKLDSAGVEQEVGSGGPGFTAGLNLMLLNTAANNWAADKTDNFNFELAVGDWAAYADAAGTAPVDMTGGSPNTTMTRDTTTEINGVASGLMTISSGATRQGEGVSCLVNIPTAYRGKTLTFKFPYVLTGTVIEDDLRLYAYDVTNSIVITPYTSGKILGSSGTAVCSIAIPTNTAQIRVGIHIARAVNTGAVTLEFDDVVLTSESTPIGMAGSDTIAYVPTLNSTSNVAVNIATYQRIGDSIHIKGHVRWNGTGSAGLMTVSLPNGLTADVTKMNTDGSALTQPTDLGNAMWLDAGNALFTMWPRINSSNYTQFAFLNTAGSGFQQSSTANHDQIQYEVILPVVGWSSNVTMAESSTFKISSILANGTRVTSTPTKLGEYRTFTKNSSSNAGTDNAPSTAPSPVNGMLIYGVPYTSAGTNGQPNRWEIFVGKNKTVQYEFFRDAGKSVVLDPTGVQVSSTEFTGTFHGYDPNTGIAFLDTMLMLSSITAGRYVGSSIPAAGGSGSVGISSGYFDLIVSENALAVGMQVPRSEVFVVSGNGHGSTNTKIRRFSTTSKNIGTAITYSDSSTAGASFTINETGVYSITYYDTQSSGSARVGASVNSTALTTNIGDSGNDAFRITFNVAAAASLTGCANSTVNLNAGDVVRPHTNGSNDATIPSESAFRIVKVSN